MLQVNFRHACIGWSDFVCVISAVKYSIVKVNLGRAWIAVGSAHVGCSISIATTRKMSMQVVPASVMKIISFRRKICVHPHSQPIS